MTVKSNEYFKNLSVTQLHCVEISPLVIIKAGGNQVTWIDVDILNVLLNRHRHTIETGNRCLYMAAP